MPHGPSFAVSVGRFFAMFLTSHDDASFDERVRFVWCKVLELLEKLTGHCHNGFEVIRQRVIGIDYTQG